MMKPRLRRCMAGISRQLSSHTALTITCKKAWWVAQSTAHKLPGHAITGVVDQKFRLDAPRMQVLHDQLRRRLRVGQVGGQRHVSAGTPCGSPQFLPSVCSRSARRATSTSGIALCGQLAAKFLADAGRGAGDQGPGGAWPGASAPLRADVCWA